jgi:hypothetical protein
MPQIIHRTLTFLVLTGLLLIEPQLGLSRAAEIDPLEKNALVTQCADRIEKWFSLITIQSQKLDLEHVKLIRVEQQQVVIPLKKSHGNVKAIRWSAKRADRNTGLYPVTSARKGRCRECSALPS